MHHFIHKKKLKRLVHECKRRFPQFSLKNKTEATLCTKKIVKKKKEQSESIEKIKEVDF